MIFKLLIKLIIMCITNIRQRKLFRSHHHNQAQLRIDTQSSNYEQQKQQVIFTKTMNFQNRDSYSSRPTLQSSHVSRRVTVLQNKINKQQAMIEKCFTEMQSLESHYEALMQKQSEKYEAKLKQIKQRIKKQQERNKKIEDKSVKLIQKIIQKMTNQQSKQQQVQPYQSKRKKNNNNRTEVKISSFYNNPANKFQRASQFLQLVKFERTRREIKKIALSQELFIPRQIQNENQYGSSGDNSRVLLNSKFVCPNQSFIINNKPNYEEPDSESILLDD